MIGFSHVALLLPSVSKAASKLHQMGFSIGPEEIWANEGTKEIYAERDKTNSLLLMEPTSSGPYLRALEKRGPGLHHIAIDVTDIDKYIASIIQTGWLLHPQSIQTLKQTKTAYLARPGFPALIEIQENLKIIREKPFVKKISIPFDSSLIKLLEPIGQFDIIQRTDLKFSLTLNEHEILFQDLL